jgi:hypothetical protein
VSGGHELRSGNVACSARDLDARSKLRLRRGSEQAFFQRAKRRTDGSDSWPETRREADPGTVLTTQIASGGRVEVFAHAADDFRVCVSEERKGRLSSRSSRCVPSRLDLAVVFDGTRSPLAGAVRGLAHWLSDRCSGEVLVPQAVAGLSVYSTLCTFTQGIDAPKWFALRSRRSTGWGQEPRFGWCRCCSTPASASAFTPKRVSGSISVTPVSEKYQYLWSMIF